MKKLIIIPAYNESENIVNTIDNIKKYASDFDYIIINDCSKDNTEAICEENNFHYISLPVNLGIGGAVQTGYLYAKNNGYDIAVQVDGDGQHDTAFLNVMVEKMMELQADMIIGSRFINMEGFQSSSLRRFGIKYFTNLIKLLTGETITDPTSGLRMINKSIIDKFAEEYPRDYPEPDSVVTLLKNKYKVAEVPVLMKERMNGESSISFRKSIYYMIKVTISIFLERIN